MDLGLSSLTDDQLVELLQEACCELAKRAWFVREAAQKVIVTNAEKMQNMRHYYEMAIKKERTKYFEALREEVFRETHDQVIEGWIRVATVEEETDAIVKAARIGTVILTPCPSFAKDHFLYAAEKMGLSLNPKPDGTYETRMNQAKIKQWREGCPAHKLEEV